MSDAEAAVEIARINAAVNVLALPTVGGCVNEAAEAYLLRQFAEQPHPEPEKHVPVTASVKVGARCNQAIPGRSNNLSDVRQCVREANHVGNHKWE